MSINRIAVSLTLTISLMSFNLHADTVVNNNSYVVASPNGEFVANLREGNCNKSLPSKVTLHKLNRGKFINVETVELRDCTMPVYLVLSNNGYLLAIHSTRGSSYTPIIVIYNNKGALTKQLSLKDIFNEKQVKSMKESASKTHWRCIGVLPRVVDDNIVEIHDSIGGLIRINVLSGDYDYLSNPYIQCIS